MTSHTTNANSKRSCAELLTERQAVKVLAARAIAPRHARHALHAGLAGEPMRTPATTLYDAGRVQALLERTGVPAQEAWDACPHGLFTARRFVSVLATREAQMAKVAPGWEISLLARHWIYRWLEDFGPMPVVVTIAGFVLLGAELTGFRSAAEAARRNHVSHGPVNRVNLVLREPGDWFAAFEGRRLSTDPGNAWRVIGSGRRGQPRRG